MFSQQYRRPNWFTDMSKFCYEQYLVMFLDYDISVNVLLVTLRTYCTFIHSASVYKGKSIDRPKLRKLSRQRMVKI